MITHTVGGEGERDAAAPRYRSATTISSEVPNMTRIKFAAVVLAATSFAAGIALADGRPPTAEETSAISAALTKEGFTKWRKIEFDDGKWEVDDAIGADGKQYDVDLSAKDLSIIKKEIDHD
jgi:hypothetical protein